MSKPIHGVLCAALALGPLVLSGARAAEVKVAVAANFTAAMKEIAAGFERATGHQALLSFGSTGKLYAQIIHGAPFAVFLAADQERPRLLEDQGKASGRFTYAIGKLVLYSAEADLVDAEGKVLAEGAFDRLAIANPKTAPYGAAAMEVLDDLGLTARLTPRLVRGDSIAQTYQFVATGSAELGFVALAQVVLQPQGSRWEVPQSRYTPIRQDAVLLETGADEPAALALIDYLKTPATRVIIERFGYATEDSGNTGAARGSQVPSGAPPRAGGDDALPPQPAVPVARAGAAARHGAQGDGRHRRRQPGSRLATP